MANIGQALQNWIINGTFPSAIEFHRDVVADRRIYSRLVPDKIIITNRNAYDVPRGILWSENDVDEHYNLGQYYNGGSTGSATFDMISLDKQLTVQKFFNLVELRAWTGDGNDIWSYFNLGEAERIIDLKVEKANINYIKEHSIGNFSANLVVENGEINAYKTLIKCQKQLINKGVNIDEIIYYVSPDFYEMLMRDGVIIANGQSEIQSSDVRRGLTGTIGGKGDASDFIMTGSGIAIAPSLSKRDDKMLMVVNTLGNLWLVHHVGTPLQFVPVGLDVHSVAAIKLVYVVWYTPYIIDKGASGVVLDTRGDAVTGITLNKNSTSIEVNKSEKLIATIAPETAYDKTVTFSSDHPEIAFVATDGTVTGIAAGSATITAKANGGNFSATCSVTVTE